MKKLYTLPALLFFSALFIAQAQSLRDGGEDLLEKQRKEKKLKAIKRPSLNTRRFYDYRGSIRKNSVKIQPFHLINTAKLTYERVVHRKFSVGINVSYNYLGSSPGTSKYDLFGKYFLTYRAPIGLYVYTSHGYANIANHTFNYRRSGVEEGKDAIYNPNRPFVVSQTVSFGTYIGTLGLGFQNATGPKKNIIVDFGIGYQFYSIPASYKNSIVAHDLVYGNFDANNGLLGPTSPLVVRFGVGFMF